MALIDDWQAFVRGDADFDRSHFSGLFKEYSDELYIRAALKGVACGEEVGDRIIQVISENTGVGFEYLVPSPQNYRTEDDIRSLVARSVAELKAFLMEAGADGLPRQINERQLTYNENSEIVEDMLSDESSSMCEIEDLISDLFTKKVADRKFHYLRELREAVIYISLIPSVTRFILDPIIKIGMDCKPHYEVWKGGGAMRLLKAALYFL